MLGIDNYDAVISMDKLVFKMREALLKFQVLWKTLDKEKIYDIIKLCLARELQCVEERKDATEYALKRPKSFDSFDINNDLSAVKSQSWGQSSPSRAGSPSPKKPNLGSTRMGLDTMKTGGRDLNTTGLDLKSIGESEGRGRPVSFKEPPRLGNLGTQVDAPTAAKLRKLGTNTSIGARSDNGGRSARRSEVSAGGGRQSYRSTEPVCIYKEHTVEQMDVLIADSTMQINQLNFKVKQVEKDAYATRTTI